MKVVLTGPECSGKTTLAMQLAEHFGVSIAPEPARGHLQPEQVYQPSDLLQLTAVQRRLEMKEHAGIQVLILICRPFISGGRKSLARCQRFCGAVMQNIPCSAIEYIYFVVPIFPGNMIR